MRSLVTGGDGFVGQHLISCLLAADRTVAATFLGDAPADGTLTDDEREAVTWYRADVLDRASVGLAVEDWLPVEIYHLAGFASGAAARDRPRRAVRVNVGGTLTALDVVADSPISDSARVVVAGSADAYGPPDPPDDDLTELAPLRPTSAYGASKAGQERVALAVAAARHLDVRVARMFPLLGPGQGEEFVVPSFCRQARRVAEAEVEPVLRVGDLTVVRDFTHVRDGVRALQALGGLERTRYPVYNICSGSGVAIGELLEWVLLEAGVRPRVEIDPARLRPDEPRRVVGSPERLWHETGWTVERDVRKGVRESYHGVNTRPETESGGKGRRCR